MGKSSSIVTGYHYRPAFHQGIGRGPIDAYLEWRVADKPAWQGELTESGIVTVSKPNLFGGKKDQGGVEGELELMFGEATQLPNSYLASTFGPQQPAWRGLTTMVWRGGRFGANNPYAQKNASKIRKILKGWDNDECWYEAKAVIPLGGISSSKPDWRYLVVDVSDTADYSDPSFNDSSWQVGPAPFGDEFLFNPDTPGDNPQDRGFDPMPATIVPERKRVWLRTNLVLPSVPADGFQFDAYVDNGITVWVNGVEALTNWGDFNHSFQTTIPAALFHSGSNSVVVAGEDMEFPPPGLNFFYFDLRFTSLSPLLGMNPAHILVYSRTDSERGREPLANINSASLTAAADKLYGEGFGLCTEYDPANESPAEFEQRICRVIAGSFERSITDGQYYLDLARGDYVIEDLPILTDDDILDFQEQPTTLDRAVNSLSVRYFDPEKKETIVTPAVRALALVRKFGEIHETLDFPEIPIGSLALRVAERELRSRCTPTRGFKLVTTPRTYAWRPNQYFRLQSVKRGIADMVCLVGQKTRGTLKSGAINLIATQDIYSLPDTSYVEIEPGVDTQPPQVPGVIEVQRADEVPYFELSRTLPRAELAVLPPEAGYVMAAASDPDEGRDFTMMVAPDGGEFEEGSTGYWCPTATTLAAAGIGTTVVELDQMYLLDQVEIGAPALWDDELVRVDAIDLIAGTVTLGRGCADTAPPPEHAAGSRIWFYDLHAAGDTTEYTDGETVEVRLLTNTGSEQLDIGLATPMDVTLDQRAYRPYPPGQLRINDDPAPSYAFGVITVEWTHRDRVLQADQLVDTEAASIGPEPGTTCTLRLYVDDVLQNTVAGITGTSGTIDAAVDGTARLEVESVRDGVTSWQMHVREFAYTVAEADPWELQGGGVLQEQSGATIYFVG
jgi:hypothetical protein